MEKSPIQIVEEDIKYIEIIQDVVDDHPEAKSVMTLEKNEKKNRYEIIYNYENLDDHYRYCEVCGNIYERPRVDCPQCAGYNIDIVPRDMIDEVIYSYLEDGAIVNIIEYSHDHITLQL